MTLVKVMVVAKKVFRCSRLEKKRRRKKNKPPEVFLMCGLNLIWALFSETNQAQKKKGTALADFMHVESKGAFPCPKIKKGTPFKKKEKDTLPQKKKPFPKLS